MADIAMCNGNNCAARQSCYRYRARSDGEYQTYSDFDRAPIAAADDCAFFWPLERAEGPLGPKGSKPQK